jgi:hypothetical protein
MDRFGLPLRICSNFAKEHVPIKDHIEVVWVGTKNPCLIRSSTKNQVNELMMDNIFGVTSNLFFFYEMLLSTCLFDFFLCSLCE